MNYRLSALALGATLLVGCASSSSGDQPQGRSDPLEGFNRTMFNFNFNVVDPYVLRPSRWHGVTTSRSRRAMA
jgi:phospholipid-binding lipoprotein MlaA